MVDQIMQVFYRVNAAFGYFEHGGRQVVKNPGRVREVNFERVEVSIVDTQN